MSLTFQLLTGTALLAVCSMVHIGVLVILVGWLTTANRWARGHAARLRWAIVVTVAFGTIAISHLLQVAIWTALIFTLDHPLSLEEGIYFALVTYTTLGYGDVVLGEGIRVFAAMAAVTGVLNFGLSTAFLVGLLGKILPGVR